MIRACAALTMRPHPYKNEDAARILGFDGRPHGLIVIANGATAGGRGAKIISTALVEKACYYANFILEEEISSFKDESDWDFLLDSIARMACIHAICRTRGWIRERMREVTRSVVSELVPESLIHQPLPPPPQHDVETARRKPHREGVQEETREEGVAPGTEEDEIKKLERSFSEFYAKEPDFRRLVMEEISNIYEVYRVQLINEATENLIKKLPERFEQIDPSKVYAGVSTLLIMISHTCIQGNEEVVRVCFRGAGNSSILIKTYTGEPEYWTTGSEEEKDMITTHMTRGAQIRRAFSFREATILSDLPAIVISATDGACLGEEDYRKSLLEKINILLDDVKRGLLINAEDVRRVLESVLKGYLDTIQTDDDATIAAAVFWRSIA